MPRLILMRHAKSDWDDPRLPDHDRPLNKRGRASAKALGDWLRAEGHLPGEVLCSTAERTRETLRGLRLDPATKTSFLRTLYLAEAETMLAVLQEARAGTVLLIGHNPGIADFAARLVTAPPAHDRFDDYPTGATLVCDVDGGDWSGVDWRSAQPVAFVTPRELTD